MKYSTHKYKLMCATSPLIWPHYLAKETLLHAIINAILLRLFRCR